MTKYLTAYKEYIKRCLADPDCDFEKLLDYHTEKLRHFQHERFIHLIVMVLFALCVMMSFIAIAVWGTVTLIPLAALLLALLIPYIKHYYFLENSVQSLYKDYDEIYRRVHGFCQEDGK
ncbi:MAG: hypothetical protein IJ737_01900 [Ruminococcus sp.]|nr:hypothetical protein [Ruminococcus sp.]